MMAYYCSMCGHEFEHPSAGKRYCRECGRRHRIEVGNIKKRKRRQGIVASSYDDDWRESVKMRFCIYCRAEIGMTDRVIYACKKCESKLPKKKAAKEAPLITKTVPTVSEIANLAAAAGMSYGQYVSKYGV